MHKWREPFGGCRVDIGRFSVPGTPGGGFASLRFQPKGTGAYSIRLLLPGGKEAEGSPYLVLADFSGEEARKCHVLPEDEQLFKKRLRFRGGDGGGGGVTFRVSTLAAVEASSNPGELSVLCFGPRSASVRLSKHPEEAGLEVCQVVPSAPGDYRLTLLWKGQRIGNGCNDGVSGSDDGPLTLQFRRPKPKLVANGLDLQDRTFPLELPFTFKLNCSDLAGGPGGGGGVALGVACDTHDACNISVTPVSDRKATYECELVPKKAGTHTLHVGFGEGRPISGSPFRVRFEDASDPGACRIVEGVRTYTVGGPLVLKVSTEGAGPGLLEATAKDPDTLGNGDGNIDGNGDGHGNTVIAVSTKQLSPNLYQVEFDPTPHSAGCILGLTYNQRHIPGSPFTLLLRNPDSFSLSGEGLLAAHHDAWNTFTVQAVDPPPRGTLGVKVSSVGRGGGG